MKFLFLFALLAMGLSCNTGQKKKTENADWSKNQSVSYHQEVNEREQLQIALFLEHHKELKVQTSASGLRYYVYKTNPKGVQGEPGKIASTILKVSLLSGKICYETEKEYFDEIPIDHNDKESGINEGLKLMRTGEKAKLILPNHLAHGLLGDLANIPPLSIVVVDVELVELR